MEEKRIYRGFDGRAITVLFGLLIALFVMLALNCVMLLKIHKQNNTIIKQNNVNNAQNVAINANIRALDKKLKNWQVLGGK